MDIETLRLRSALLQEARLFFLERGFLEVETPIASPEVIPEAHIDPVKFGTASLYLQASPELAMKRLLCDGSGPIFQITKCFRNDEHGSLHRPEFTMLEWYRPGDDMNAGIELLESFLDQVVGVTNCKRTSFQAAFQEHLDINPYQISQSELIQVAVEQSGGKIDLDDWKSATRDQLLDYLLTSFIEPKLGVSNAEIIFHYPDTQAALACTVEDSQGNLVAERFELYVNGLELANGYHELTDTDELEKRLLDANESRAMAGKETLPMPHQLLEDMHQKGMPSCAGVAFGFDRLVMLVSGKQDISEVISCDDVS